jgi:uncharacterized iron-regulated membrane protein
MVSTLDPLLRAAIALVLIAILLAAFVALSRWLQRRSESFEGRRAPLVAGSTRAVGTDDDDQTALVRAAGQGGDRDS